jgi:hypothetical protein
MYGKGMGKRVCGFIPLPNEFFRSSVGLKISLEMRDSDGLQ